jgi:hypothetical protein
MKFSFSLIFLIFIVTIAQAAPVAELTKRKAGSTVTPLGVRFEGYYKKFNSQVSKVNQKFYHEISQFNDQVPAAAKEDGTDADTLNWLLTWNKHYESLVDDLDKTTKSLDKSIDKLHKKLTSS